MNTLLIYFALPVATIILAVVLQKLIKCYKLVTAIFFAIYLIVTFAAFDSSFLIFAIAYTILAFIASYLTYIICRIIRRFNINNDCDCNSSGCRNGRSRNNSNCGCNRNNCRCDDNDNNCGCSNNDNNDLLTISYSGCNGRNNDLLTISSNCSGNNGNNGINSLNDGNDFSANSINNLEVLNNNNTNNCNCNNSQRVQLTANVVPNMCNNGRTGSFNGCYRRK